MRPGHRTLPALALALCLGAQAAAAAPADAPAPDPAAQARAAVGPSLRAMAQAANAHDVDGHVNFYSHRPEVTLIVNGEAIVGWDTIRARQAEWWRGGKSDVVYTPLASPQYRALAPGLVLTTLMVGARGSGHDGKPRDDRLAISSLWQHESAGWRVIYAHESTTH